MNKLMIKILDEYDWNNAALITNPTSRSIYEHMKKETTYTNKGIAKELNIPLSTVTGRVSDLVIRGYLVEHRIKPGTTLRGFKKI